MDERRRASRQRAGAAIVRRLAVRAPRQLVRFACAKRVGVAD